LVQALGLNLAIGVLALGMPLMMQILTDDVLVRGDGEMLRSLAIGILLLFVFRALLNLLQGVLVGHFGQKLQLQMVLHYGQHLLRLPLSYFESRRSGEVVSRLDDIQKLNDLIADLTLGLPGQFCIAVISLIWMWHYSGSLTLAALVGYGMVVATQLAVLPSLHRRTQQLLVQSATTRGFWWNCSVGRPCSRPPRPHPRHGRNSNATRDDWPARPGGWACWICRTSTVTSFLGQAIGIALLWYGSVFVLQQQLSIGQLLAFNGMGANVLAFLAGLSGVSQELITSRVVMARLDDASSTPWKPTRPKEASRPGSPPMLTSCART
jgi:ABC-type bacteriocin/lantibiotic exporter with double-glycine peptidase domain